MNHGPAKTRDRMRWLVEASSSIQDSRRRVLVRRRTRILTKERSSTKRRFASFPSPLCWAGRAVGRDERALTGALDSLSRPLRRSVVIFCLDNADVVIELGIESEGQSDSKSCPSDVPSRKTIESCGHWHKADREDRFIVRCARTA
jgi:hypothetical protein